ncbi:MAG: cysteate synthase [Phycisphaerales bacterium JB038]
MQVESAPDTDDTPAALESICLSCGKRLPAIERACPDCPTALLRAAYPVKPFRPTDHPGIFRFTDFLPPIGAVDTKIGPCVYRSEALAAKLGLGNLHIAYNGYAPEKHAWNLTASFKDFEALPTLLFLREHGVSAVSLASAGNTARAFAYAGALLGFNVHIVIPEALLPSLWIPAAPSLQLDCVHVTAVAGSRDYFKAIELNQRIVREFGLTDEGGARNIARRDGMGTAVLEHARVAGELPRHYFQAVGSGTGGIAAWEASQRLLATGAFGERPPHLHLAQNAPFAPIPEAWTHGKKIEPNADIDDQLRRIDEISAAVLANRNPPYGLVGGVRDALRETGGRTCAVSNAEAAFAQALFEEAEGIPIGPEAGVALGALRQALEHEAIDRKESILLHVTGGGESLLRRDYDLTPLEPTLRIAPEAVSAAGLKPHRSHFQALLA